MHDKSAFTLIETMVATTIAVIVLGAIVNTLIFCHRILQRTMAEAESSLALREIRDKLLFHAGIKNGTRLNNGLLTGIWKADDASITMQWEDAQDKAEDSIRIIFKSDDKGNYLFNEKCPHVDANDKWFRPRNFRLSGAWSTAVEPPFIYLNLTDPSFDGVISRTRIRLPDDLNVDKDK